MSRLSCDSTTPPRDLLPNGQAPSTSSHGQLLPMSSSPALAQALSVPPTRPNVSAKDRFRSLVNKVINRNRACAIMKEVAASASLEQGVDPSSAAAERRFGSYRTKCTIEVVHYSESKCRTASFTNSELVRWLGENFPTRRQGEVRWINVGGISWDVVKALAVRYDLHPLSVEDVMTSTLDKSFKVDYYHQHLFAQLTSYKLKSDVDEEAIQGLKLPPANSASSFYVNGRAKSHQPSPKPPTLQLPTPDPDASPASRPKSLRSQSSSLSELGRATLAVVQPTTQTLQSRSSDEGAIQALKLQSGALEIKSTRVFVFLLRDGTLLSIHEEPTLYGTELKEQLYGDSLIRSMEDVSMLFHGFLDLVVDHLIKISDGYQVAILALERGVLLKPTMAAMQTLHLLSGDIELLRMSIKPLQRIIYGLRRYDRERCKGLATAHGGSPAQTRGFLSEETKIYLTDIYDHIRYVMLSLDTHSSTARELISFSFNLTSCDSTNVMRKLLIVTVIFLPLTFITQYFGMNFAVMDSVQQHSDALFWKIAGPVIGTLILVALRNRLLKVIIPEH